MCDVEQKRRSAVPFWLRDLRGLTAWPASRNAQTAKAAGKKMHLSSPPLQPTVNIAVATGWLPGALLVADDVGNVIWRVSAKP